MARLSDHDDACTSSHPAWRAASFGTAEDAAALEPERVARLEKAFARGDGHGLLSLGADEPGTALPPVLSYWRDLGARYVTALCALPGDRRGQGQAAPFRFPATRTLPGSPARRRRWPAPNT